MVTVITSGG